MLLSRLLYSLYLFAATASCVNHLLPRATASSYINSTVTSAPSPTLVCCHLQAHDVKRVEWFTGSVDYTVAIVSTIVYQYDDIATTSYKTVSMNNTLPSSSFLSNEYTFDGVPTTVIGFGGPYLAYTKVVIGTAFTDPYGVVYQSPTPVIYFDGYVTYYTDTATPTGNSYACPTQGEGGINLAIDILPVYPSGYYEIGTGNYTDNKGEFFDKMSPKLVSWMVTHVPPDADPVWSNLASCIPGGVDGIPVAHIPVNALTHRPLTTITIDSTLSPIAAPITEPQIPVPTPQPSPDPPVVTPSPPANSPLPVETPSPPTNSPPANTPPVNTPPANTPLPPANTPTPIETPSPPENTPPANTPPVNTPPANTPPSNTPPNTPSPPVNTPPVITPPANSPSPNTPPVSISLAITPPANTPPANSPPVGTPLPSPNNPSPSPNPNASPNPGQTNTQPSPNTLIPIPIPITIASQTLNPGSTVIIPGLGTQLPTTYVLPPTGTGILIINNTPTTLLNSPIPTPITIASQALTPGGTITVPGLGTQAPTTYILPSTGTGILIIDGTPSTLPNTPVATQTSQITTNAQSQPQIIATQLLTRTQTNAIITLASSLTYTLNSASAFIINSQTLTIGGTITATNGDVISLQTSAIVIVNSKGDATSTQAIVKTTGVVTSSGARTVAASMSESKVSSGISSTSSRTQEVGDIIVSMGGFGSGTGSAQATSSSTSSASLLIDVSLLSVVSGFPVTMFVISVLL